MGFNSGFKGLNLLDTCSLISHLTKQRSRALEGAVKSKGFDNSKGKDSTGNCSLCP